jgi:hypothetical protein
MKKHAVGPLQEQHGATKIQESKTESMKLSITEHYKQQIQKEIQYRIKRGNYNIGGQYLAI